MFGLLRPARGVAWAVGVIALFFGLLLPLAGCGRSSIGNDLDLGYVPFGDSGRDSIGPDTPDVPDTRVLLAIEVRPASMIVPAGGTFAFTARGLYSDGGSGDVTTSVTWSTDDPSIASIDPSGRLSANRPGNTLVRATLGGIVGQALVSVPRPALVGLTIDPPSGSLTVGGGTFFRATAHYGDGSSSDVTTIASWTSDNPIVATVTSGAVIGNGPGSAGITASFGGYSAFASVTVVGKPLARLEISPTSTTAGVGVNILFSAMAIYVDGTSADVTSSSLWSSSDPFVATVIPSGAFAGEATTSAPGATSISASYGGLVANASLNVTGAPLTGLTVTPSSALLPFGGSTKLRAIASYADGTTVDVTASAVWLTGDPSVAMVSGGVVNAVRPGTTSVTANFGGFSASATISVTSVTIAAITISPDPVVIALGTKLPLRATATLSDGSTADVTASVTWSIDDPAVASIDTSGIAASLSPGATLVRARLGSVEGLAKLVVPSSKIVSVAITPNPVAVAKGKTVSTLATATFSDGSTGDVTSGCAWSSADATIATVSNAPGSQGQVTGISAGSTSITCSVAGVASTVTVTVTGSTVTLVSIAVVPASTFVPIGASVPLQAIGTYSDGSTADLLGVASWSSDAPSVATVDATGRVTGVSAGSARIRASVGSIFGESAITVPTITVTSIRVDPNPSSTTVGGNVKYTATAILSDGTTADVTGFATWSTGDPTVASMLGNVATGLSAGSTTVVATVGPFSGSAKLTVTSGKTLARIDVTPFSPTIAVGSSITLTATGIYADGSTADVTTSATWSSSSPGVANVDASGKASGVTGGSAVISASLSGITGGTPITVTTAKLLSVSVSPTSATIAKGEAIALKATATYSDGTSSDVTAGAVWTSSDGTIASVAAGNVKGVAPGTATITASFGGLSGSSTITVSAATLVSIAISPTSPSVAVSGTIAFKATATYNDGSTGDVTSSVAWSTDDGTIATISNAPGSQGLAKGASSGTTTVRASLSGVAASTSITVTTATLKSIAITPSPLSLVQGDKAFATATATYTDGSTANVSTTCVWATKDASIADVSNAAGSQGQVSGVGVGSTTLICSLSSVTGSATVNVSSPALASIGVTPINPTCRIGDVLQFTATAIDTSGKSSNVTFAATWTSSDTSVLQAIPGPRGRFRCIAKGTSTITAAYGGLTSTSTATVTDATVVSIQVDPASTTIPNGWVQPFQATAIFSDGTSQNVTGVATWTSSAPPVASISDAGGSKGRATALSGGTTTISASYKGVTGSTSLTVSTATITSISVSPTARDVPVGTRFGYTAQAIYSDGTSKDITALATWLSSSPSVAAVSDAAGSKGQAAALASGSTTITATWSGVSGNASLNVTAATLTSIQVTPFTDSVAVGVSVFYRADAVYSDGTTVDVTGRATWTSSDASVAAVSDAAGSKGRATTIKSGTTSISASFGGKTGSATLTVTTAKLTAIQLTPFKPFLPVGFGVFVTATAVYDDGSTIDVTNVASWTSTNPSIASVSDGGGTKGLVTPNTPGVATVRATWGGMTGGDDVTVTTATLTSIAVTPNPGDITIGSGTGFTATGTFSDGNSFDVTAYVGWSSSDPSIADVSNAGGDKGTAYGFKPGAVTITATRGSVKGSAKATVR